MSNPPLWQPPPHDDQDTYDTFVNLKNETERVYFEELHMSDENGEQNCWIYRHGHSMCSERLYRFGKSRWLLCFTDFIDSLYFRGPRPINRELDPAVAARWFRFNHFPIPSELSIEKLQKFLPVPASCGARLGGSWRPPTESGDNQINSEASGESSEPPQTHEAEQDEAPIPIAPVVLRGRNEGPVVYGKVKKRLSNARYNIITALLEADCNLMKDELDKKSGHTDARKFLKKMAQKDEDWARAIVMPDGPGTGYGIHKLPPT